MIKLKKIGLALGGGGARGLAHIGVLQHLEKIGLAPEVLAGTSAGAAIATLYAFKVPLAQIQSELEKLKPIEFSSLRIPKLGLMENTTLAEMLDRLIGKDAKIEDSPIPLAIKATDIISGESVLLTSGSVRSAVLASCCVPGIYIPVERDGKLLVDGGLTENVPVSALDTLKASLKIAVNLNGNQTYPKPEGIFDVLANSLDISIDHQTWEQIELADIVISMDLSRFSRFRNDQARLLIEEGFKAAQKEIPNANWLSLRRRLRHWRKTLESFSPIKVPDKIKAWWKSLF
jgi:NTE family protein